MQGYIPTSGFQPLISLGSHQGVLKFRKRDVSKDYIYIDERTRRRQIRHQKRKKLDPIEVVSDDKPWWLLEVLFFPGDPTGPQHREPAPEGSVIQQSQC